MRSGVMYTNIISDAVSNMRMWEAAWQRDQIDSKDWLTSNMRGNTIRFSIHEPEMTEYSLGPESGVTKGD